MFYKKPSLLQKAKMQQKAEIDKINNQKVARKVDVYTNAVIDDYVLNAGTHKGYTPKMVTSTLKAINKPKVDAEYQKAITSSKTSDSLYHQVKIQKMANEKTIQITEAQYDRLQKNIKAVDRVLRNYELDINKYKKISKERPKTESRRGIISESVMNTNYITGLGYNIKPHVFGYKDLTPVTEGMHRNVQNEAQRELAQSENDEALSKGEEAPNQWKTWIWTGRGATTRHESNDGQTVPFDEPFIIVNDDNGEVDEMMYPLDPSVTSSNGWLCYCEVEYHNNPPESSNFFDFGKGDLDALSLVNELSKMQLPHHEGERKFDVTHDNWEDLRLQVELSDDIPAQHKKLATRLIWEYAHAYHSKAEAVEEYSWEHGYLGANPHKTEFEIVSTYEGIFEFLKQHKLEITEEALVELSENPSVNATVNLVKRQIENFELYTDGAVPHEVENIAEAISEAKDVIKEEQTKEAIENAATKTEENIAKYQDYLNELLNKEDKPLKEKADFLKDEVFKLDEIVDNAEMDYVELYQKISYFSEKTLEVLNQVEHEANTNPAEYVKNNEGVLGKLDTITSLIEINLYHFKNNYELSTEYKTLADNHLTKNKENKKKLDEIHKTVNEEEKKLAAIAVYEEMLSETYQKLQEALELAIDKPEAEEQFYLKLMEAVNDSIIWYNSSLDTFELANQFKLNAKNTLQSIAISKVGKQWADPVIESNIKHILSAFHQLVAEEGKIYEMSDFVSEKLKEIQAKKLEQVATEEIENNLIEDFKLENTSEIKYLTNEQVKLLDQVIDSVHGEFKEILTEFWDKDTVKTKYPHLDEIAESIGFMQFIPEADKQLAAQMIFEYAKKTELEYLPLQATYEVLKANFEHSEGGVEDIIPQTSIHNMKSVEEFKNMSETELEEFKELYEDAVKDVHGKGTWSWEYEGGSMYGLNKKVDQNYSIPDKYNDIVVKLVYDYYQMTHQPVEIVPFYEAIKENTKFIKPLGYDYLKVKSFNDLIKLTEAEKAEIKEAIDNEALNILVANKDLHTFEYADGKAALKDEVMAITEIPFSEKKFAIDLIWEYMTHNKMEEIDVLPAYKIFEEATKLKENYDPNKPLYEAEPEPLKEEDIDVHEYAEEVIEELKQDYDEFWEFVEYHSDWYENELENPYDFKVVEGSEDTGQLYEGINNSDIIPEPHKELMMEITIKFMEAEPSYIFYPDMLYMALKENTDIFKDFDAKLKTAETGTPKELTVGEIIELMEEMPLENYAEKIYEEKLQEDWEEIQTPMEEKVEEIGEQYQEGYNVELPYEYDGYEKEELKDVIESNPNIPEQHKEFLYELSLLWADNVGEVYPEIFYEMIKEHTDVFEKFDEIIGDMNSNDSENIGVGEGFETSESSYGEVYSKIDVENPINTIQDFKNIPEEIKTKIKDVQEELFDKTDEGVTSYESNKYSDDIIEAAIQDSNAPPEYYDFLKDAIEAYYQATHEDIYVELFYDVLRETTNILEVHEEFLLSDKLHEFDSIKEQNEIIAENLDELMEYNYDPMIEAIEEVQTLISQDSIKANELNFFELAEYENIVNHFKEQVEEFKELYEDQLEENFEHEDLVVEVSSEVDTLLEAIDVYKDAQFDVLKEELTPKPTSDNLATIVKIEVLSSEFNESVKPKPENKQCFKNVNCIGDKFKKIIDGFEEVDSAKLSVPELEKLINELEKTEYNYKDMMGHLDNMSGVELTHEQDVFFADNYKNLKAKKEEFEELIKEKKDYEELDTLLKDQIKAWNAEDGYEWDYPDMEENAAKIKILSNKLKKQLEEGELSEGTLQKIKESFETFENNVEDGHYDIFSEQVTEIMKHKDLFDAPEPVKVEVDPLIQEKISEYFEPHEELIKKLDEKWEELEADIADVTNPDYIAKKMKMFSFEISVINHMAFNFNNEGLSKIKEYVWKTKTLEGKLDEMAKNGQDYKEAMENLKELEEKLDTLSENPVTNLEYHINKVEEAISSDDFSDIYSKLNILDHYNSQVLEPLKEADLLTEPQKVAINKKISELQEQVEYVTEPDNVNYGKEQAEKLEDYKFESEQAEPLPEYKEFEDYKDKIDPIKEELEAINEKIKTLDDLLENSPELVTTDEVNNLNFQYNDAQNKLNKLLHEKPIMDIESSKLLGETITAAKDTVTHLKDNYSELMAGHWEEILDYSMEWLTKEEYYHTDLNEGIVKVFENWLNKNEYTLINQNVMSFTDFGKLHNDITDFIENQIKPNEHLLTETEKSKIEEILDSFAENVKEGSNLGLENIDLFTNAKQILSEITHNENKEPSNIEESALTQSEKEELKQQVELIENLIKVEHDYGSTKKYIEEFNEIIEELSKKELSKEDKAKISDAVFTIDTKIATSNYSNGMKDILTNTLKTSLDKVVGYHNEGEINLLEAPEEVIHDAKKLIDEISEFIEEDAKQLGEYEMVESGEGYSADIEEKMSNLMDLINEASEIDHFIETKEYWEKVFEEFKEITDDYEFYYDDGSAFYFDGAGGSDGIETFNFKIDYSQPAEKNPAVNKFVDKHSKFIEEELVFIDSPLELTKQIKKIGKDYRQLFENEKVSHEDQVTIINMGEKIRKAVFENLREGIIFDHDGNQHDMIRVMLQKEIPEKRVIEAYQNRQEEGFRGEAEEIHMESRNHIVQGKGTVGYYLQFEPVKPPKEILRKFYEFEPWTREELNSLKENPGQLHYIINLLERPVVCEGNYRPVGHSEDTYDYLGRDLMTEHEPDFNEAAMTWTSNEYKLCNEFYDDPFKFINNHKDSSDFIPEHENYDSNGDTYGNDVDYDGVSFKTIYKLKDLTKTIIPEGFIFYRGTDNFHVNDNPNDPKGNHAEDGTVFCWDRFNSVSLMETCGGFAAFDKKTGHMTNRLTTILSPPGAEGGYLDYRSHFEHEGELLHGPRMEYQQICLDDASNTMLVRVVKDKYREDSELTPKEEAVRDASLKMEDLYDENELESYLDYLYGF